MPPKKPAPTRSAASRAVGTTQPKGSVRSASTEAVAEK